MGYGPSGHGISRSDLCEFREEEEYMVNYFPYLHERKQIRLDSPLFKELVWDYLWRNKFNGSLFSVIF